MSQQEGRAKKAKRRRDKKCKPPGVQSRGLRRARKHPLTELEKVLMGKGVAQNFRYNFKANR